MVSKRNFAIMTIMMIVVLILFMATRVFQDNKDRYTRNGYYQENPAKVYDWTESSYGDAEFKLYAEESRVIIYIGDASSKEADIVKDWCYYTKCQYKNYQSLSELSGINISLVNLVIVGPEDLNTDVINRLTSSGVSVLYYKMPEYKVISGNKNYQEIFGIQKAVSERCELSGIKLFSGFMLGGEYIYKPKNAGEEKLQDLKLNVPWYQVDEGTKVFMVGMMDRDDVTNEQLPPIIWRTYQGGGYVYTINGNYFKDNSAFGIISSVINDSKPYYIYPVVNSQTISVVDFPVMANENEEMMEALYSRSASTFCRDVLFPGIVSFEKINGLKMSVYMMPQAGYTDDIYPKSDMLDFYFRQFYQNDIEMGMSAVLHDDQVSVSEKLISDTDYYKKYCAPYRIGSVYTDDLENLNLADAFDNDVYTLVCSKDTDRRIVSVSENNMTIQKISADAKNYRYSSDFEMRSLETSMGYSNILFDLSEVFLPDKDSLGWEALSDEIFRTAGTYWKPFSGYDQTTVSDADRRIRNYINMNYSFVSHDNEIKLNMINTNDGWFVLRTHNQSIKKLSGGSYTNLEENAYLVHAQSENIVITLEDSNRENLMDF